MTGFPLVRIGMVVSVAVLLSTLIVVGWRTKLVLGTIAVVLVVLGIAVPTTPGGIIIVFGIPIIGIACLIYLLWKGYIFKT